MSVRPGSSRPRPPAGAAWLRMLATLALAALAAVMIVLADRDPAAGAAVQCFPYTEAARAMARAPSAIVRPVPVAASRADARCLKIAQADMPGDRAGARR